MMTEEQIGAAMAAEAVAVQSRMKFETRRQQSGAEGTARHKWRLAPIEEGAGPDDLSDAARAILRYGRVRGLFAQKDAQHGAGISQNAAHFHMRNLEQAGLVERFSVPEQKALGLTVTSKTLLWALTPDGMTMAKALGE